MTAAADALPVGVHTAPLAFTNVTRNIGNTVRTATLTVQAPAAMTVTPAVAFVASGPQGQQGSAFTPSSTTYTVQNTGALPMNYTVTGAPAWASVSPTSGTIPAGGTQVVSVALNAAASALAVGAQTATLSFANTTNTIGNTTRGMTLTVVEPARLTVTPADGLVSSGFQGGTVLAIIEGLHAVEHRRDAAVVHSSRRSALARCRAGLRHDPGGRHNDRDP